MTDHHFVSDDPETALVMIQFGLNKGWLERCTCPDEQHFIFDESRADEYIQQAIDDGIFKLHLELNEWYYHPTDAGRELLLCKCCGDPVYTEDDLKKGSQHCKE